MTASIAIPAASDGGVDLKVQPFSYYRDVVAPIFEALGVNSFAPGDAMNVMSVTKGVMALLTGIAVKKGFIPDVQCY